MKIGIMGAMLDEVKQLKEALGAADEKTIADRTYYSGTLNDIDVTLVFSRWGKVAASSTATVLINNFGVDFIIFTGVAGAVDEDLNIGDIVIGEALYQHDMDARPIFPRFQIPLTSNILFKPNKIHVEQASSAATSFLSNIHNEIEESSLTKFSIFKPQVYTGVIASGDQFVANPISHESLKIDSEKVLAVEMEGAAVAQVCHEHEIPYIVVRTISDKANHTADIDFQSFVTEIASNYSSGIVQEYFKRM